MTVRPFVSVVTPFYNTGEYIEECIKSVLAQTYGEFEYLLCDNCSSDGGSEIAKRLAATDPRVRYLRFEELLPQVENYNRALAHVRGDAAWVKVIQADDWLHERCLERMVDVASKDPEIGLVASYYMVGNEVRGDDVLPFEGEVFDGKDACRRQMRSGIFFMGSPSSVMYRGDIVRTRRPFYTVGRYHEDTETAYEILHHSKLGYVKEVLSYQRVRDASILGKLAGFNYQLLDRLIVADMYADNLFGPAEAAEVRGELEREYFRFLGGRRFRSCPPGFWDYHRKGLVTIGRQWPSGRILGEAVMAIVRAILNPFATGQRGWAYVRRSRKGTG